MKHFKFLNKVLNFSAERYLKTAGDLFIYDGDYESALYMVDKTLGMEPNDTRALVLRGDILYCLNRDIESLQTFNQVLKLDENCVEAYISKASVLEVLGKDRDALECCNKALELMANGKVYLRATVYEQKLTLLIRLKKYREAKQLLDEACDKISRDELQYLAGSFMPVLERHVRDSVEHRKNLRARASELSLRVIPGSGPSTPSDPIEGELKAQPQ